MRSNSKLSLLAFLGVSAATDTIWVTNTVYTCPCSTSLSLFTTTGHVSSYSPVSFSTSSSWTASSSPYSASTSTTWTSSTHSVSSTSLSASTSPGFISTPLATTISSRSSSTTTSFAPAGTCIALSGDCTNETIDYYCCPGATCDAGVDTPTCVVDSDDTTTTTTWSATTSTTTTGTTTTSSLASAGTCIALGGDCTNETIDYYCCSGAVCDAGLDTPTCVVDSS